MKRIFFGLLAIGSGVYALHFLSRWLQIRDSTGCFTDANCQHMVQRGGETGGDKKKCIGLFALAAVSIWIAGSNDHA